MAFGGGGLEGAVVMGHEIRVRLSAGEVALLEAGKLRHESVVEFVKRAALARAWVNAGEAPPVRPVGLRKPTREDFVRATAARTELFGGLRAPESAHGRAKKDG